ncbi:MAG: SpoIIIAH-like family protein [Clostridia bacterium]|nr:SpoIIIAH-like family protein [Clostridia bacterium]
MHVLIGKRQLVLAALVVALGAAVFVNWYYTGSETRLSPEGTAPAGQEDARDGAAQFASMTQEEADYFASARLDREVSQASAIEELQAVAASADPDNEAAGEASEKLAALTATIKTQNDLETLVTAAVGGDCLAVISDNSVDVIVSKSAMRDDTVLKISDIIHNVCGDAFENVRITAAGEITEETS